MIYDACVVFEYRYLALLLSELSINDSSPIVFFISRCARMVVDYLSSQELEAVA